MDRNIIYDENVLATYYDIFTGLDKYAQEDINSESEEDRIKFLDKIVSNEFASIISNGDSEFMWNNKFEESIYILFNLEYNMSYHTIISSIHKLCANMKESNNNKAILQFVYTTIKIVERYLHIYKTKSLGSHVCDASLVCKDLFAFNGYVTKEVATRYKGDISNLISIYNKEIINISDIIESGNISDEMNVYRSYKVHLVRSRDCLIEYFRKDDNK